MIKIKHSVELYSSNSESSGGSVDFGSNLYNITPHILSIVIVFLILFVSIIYYNSAIKKIKANECPKGYALIIFSFIENIRAMVRDILGSEFEKITPYFLFLFSYILISNLIGIVGFENPTASLTVTLSLGLITFLGTLVVGFRYQRMSYLKSFTFNISIKSKKQKNKKIKIPVMINPIEVIGKVSPLISISFRIWGNIFAGGLIMGLIYSIPLIFTQGGVAIADGTPGPLILVASIITPPFIVFFDMLTGVIQTMVFVFLTMIYWTLEKGEDD